MQFDLSKMKSVRAKQRAIGLWLGKSKGHIETEDLRRLCKEHECYNSPNFTVNMKKDSDLFSGNRKEGWILTDKGEQKADVLTLSSTETSPQELSQEPPQAPPQELPFNPPTTNTISMDVNQLASLLSFGWKSKGKEEEISTEFLNHISEIVGGDYDAIHEPIRVVLVRAARMGLCDPKDEVMVNAIKDGGIAASDALEILRNRLSGAIHKLCVTSDYGYGEASQQVMEGIWEAAKRYDDKVAKDRGSSWSTYCYPWLRKMARPRSDRKAGRGDRPFNAFIEDFKIKNDNGGDGGEAWMYARGMYEETNNHKFSDVVSAIESLKEPIKTVIKLRYLEGFTVEEIVSNIEGMTTWKAKKLSKEGEAQLRELLKAYDKV